MCLGETIQSGSLAIAYSAILPAIETPVKFSRRNSEKKRRASTLTIPERVGPHVKLVFAEMGRQGHRYDDVEDGSGVLRTTMKAWRSKNYPNLDSREAVFGFLGWRFVPIPADRVLPPEFVAELHPIAVRFGMSMPAAIEARDPQRTPPRLAHRAGVSRARRPR